ncbi:MAG TPA: hypothetical protein VHX62_18300 [Solirubrobacteraceae bacterium]|jgi:methylmalonyl-CoA mutase cobalamin-binding subunit|nr:hypothetical protein [Solirubrobacteraceae bacterium]
MPEDTAKISTIVKRRIVLLAIAVVGVAAILAPATSAQEQAVHAYLAKDGSTVVSGYDGGATLAKP